MRYNARYDLICGRRFADCAVYVGAITFARIIARGRLNKEARLRVIITRQYYAARVRKTYF